MNGCREKKCWTSCRKDAPLGLLSMKICILSDSRCAAEVTAVYEPILQLLKSQTLQIVISQVQAFQIFILERASFIYPDGKNTFTFFIAVVYDYMISQMDVDALPIGRRLCTLLRPLIVAQTPQARKPECRCKQKYRPAMAPGEERGDWWSLAELRG